MEKKSMKKTGIEQKALQVIKALLCAYIVTAILLLILAMLLYKTGINEANINAGIILSYVISSFAGGFVIGKLSREKKFLWGILSGVLYFFLLVVISFGIYREIRSDIQELLTTFLLCAGGGMLGGMVS